MTRERTRFASALRRKVKRRPTNLRQVAAAVHYTRHEIAIMAERVAHLQPPHELTAAHRKYVDGLFAFSQVTAKAEGALIEGDEAKAERLILRFRSTAAGKGLADALREFEAKGVGIRDPLPHR